MLTQIIEFSVKNKLIIGLFTLALIVYGSFELSHLSIDAVPDITDNQVQIITVVPSLGATDIERLITFPIEIGNSNISGIKEIRSFSRFGLSLVTIVFDDKTDIYWARQQVAERLQAVQNEIPEGVGLPELGPITTGLGEIYQYVLRVEDGYKDRYDITELRTIQDWIVRRQLLGVPGVAEVSSFGGKLKQYEIAVNPNKLHSFNLTLEDIFEALEKNNQNTGGAYIEKGPAVLFIRSEGLATNVEDLKNIAVTTMASGLPVLLKDVADVKIGFATRYGAMTYNDEGETAGAVVMMLKDGNSSQVIKNVKNRIAEIQKSLPEGVVIEPFLDRTKMVNNAISTIRTNLTEGALIVIFILVFFLGNFRAGFLVASVIPLSMLFAVIMMNIFGVSGNLMSLGALDFGLIVDGAVIIVEAVLHHLHSDKKFLDVERITQRDMDGQVKSSASKMVNSAVFGQIIILIVYLPIFTLQGIEGKMFRPMAQTVSFALIGAFILSLTYVPMMSSLVLDKVVKKTTNFSDRMLQKLENLHQKTLSKAIHSPKIVIGVASVLFLTAVFTLSRMGGEFIPALEEGDFAVDTRVLTGSSLQTTIDYTQKAVGILLSQFPEIEKVVTKIGDSEVPTDPMPMEASDMMVILKDKKEWISAKSFPELADKMGKALEVIPGLSIGFQYPVQMRFNELMTGARQDVVSKIFGDDLDSLAHYAKKIGEIVTTIDGAEDLYIETITGLPQIVIRYNRKNIAMYGLNISDVNRIVNTAFAGQSAGKVYEGERRFDLVLKLDETRRQNKTDIENLLIPLPTGGQIPLNLLAEVNIENGPAQIQREDARRRIIVGFNTRGRDVQSIVQELQEKVSKEIALPPDYYITYGGAFENLNQAKARLMLAVPVALLLILVLLYFAFRSVKEALLIYTAIPLSAIGGIFLLALRGMPFSISAGIGFIALFGVSVLNGIVLIAEFNRLKKSDESDLYNIALKGSRTRLRPVLMTASVASLGFLPMALSTGSGAEVQRPLATVVIGGLLIATFLTLYVLPTLFILFERINFKKLKRTSMAAIPVFFLFLQTPVFAQELSLEQAIDIAIENNMSLKSSNLMAEYFAKKKTAWFDLSQAELKFENGNINGPQTDNKISAVQGIRFPTVYANQKRLAGKEWESSLIAVNLNESEIRKEVSSQFYQILLLQKKRQLLEHTDKMYADFAAGISAKYEHGELGMLEKATAEVQSRAIAEQLRMLESELEIARIRFKILLNKDSEFNLVAADFIINTGDVESAISAQEHPAVRLSASEVEKAKSLVRLEQSQLLPSFSLGFINQSFRDINNKRYNVIELGISVPLFFGAQVSRINAEKKNLLYAENELDLKRTQWLSEIQIARSSFHTLQRSVKEYEEHQLKQGEIISEIAGKQFDLGEINFMEWILLNNHAIQIQTDYINTVAQYNESVIHLQYLLYRQ